MNILFFLIIGLLISLFGLILIKIRTSQRILEEQLSSKLETFMETIKTKILEATGNVKEGFSRDISELRLVAEKIKTELEIKKRLDEEMRHIVHKVENVLVGSRSRGESGENILQDAFRQFPPGMIDYNFKVRGKTVEYALILPNQKRLPIDSKWPAYELINRLSEETESSKRKELEEEVERIVIKKVKEVSEYIDPATTTGLAVAAFPDAILNVCRKAYVEAFRNRILLMSYSMTISYILAFYNLYLQHSRSIDIENLENYLSQIERCIGKIDEELENSISRGATMVSNAYSECKRLLGEIRGTITFLKVLPETSGSEILSKEKGVMIDKGQE